jgi:hypothetical protein
VSSISRFWENNRLPHTGSGSSLAGFPSNLERQNSSRSFGTATSGSVVDDLDTLMQSIDAMNEDLGLEEEETLTKERD